MASQSDKKGKYMDKYFKNESDLVIMGWAVKTLYKRHKGTIDWFLTVTTAFVSGFVIGLILSA